MQIIMLPTPGSQAGLYPDFIGKRSVFAGIGTGPADYTTGVGDPVSINFSPFYIDTIAGGVLDTTGTYIANFYSKVTGTRQQWYARYSVASTGAEYGGGTALANLQWQVGGLGGQF